MKRAIRGLSCLVPVVLFGACSAGGKNDQKYSSGVDGNLGLGDLTNQQQTTICTSQAAFLKAHVDTTALTRFWCAFTPAVLTAKDDATCETAMNGCIKEFSLQIDVTATDPNAPPPQCTTVSTSACTGTVGDYEACVNSLADLELQIGTDWQCGQRADYTSPTLGVSACNALGPTCSAVTGAPQTVH